jgi:FKBP-type peptidyl-prolyl cis-trans isomerase
MISAMYPVASQAAPDKTRLPANPVKPSLVQSTKSGLQISVTKKGSQQRLKDGDFIVVHYTGLFTSGKKFDSSLDRSEPFGFRLGSGAVIKGWDEGFKHLQVGDQALFIIPPSLAYGSKGRGDAMPPDSTLVFIVEVLGTNWTVTSSRNPIRRQ